MEQAERERGSSVAYFLSWEGDDKRKGRKLDEVRGGKVTHTWFFFARLSGSNSAEGRGLRQQAYNDEVA